MECNMDKRVEKNITSILSLRELLTHISRMPSDVKNHPLLLDALKSQGALFKYTNEELRITPMSLNTSKRIADKYTDGGFQVIDRLRLSAINAINNEFDKGNSSNKKTKSGLCSMVEELEADVEILKSTNFALIHCLTRVVSDIKSISIIENNEARKFQCNEAIRRLISIISLNPPPFDQIENNQNNIFKLSINTDEKK